MMHPGLVEIHTLRGLGADSGFSASDSWIAIADPFSPPNYFRFLKYWFQAATMIGTLGLLAGCNASNTAESQFDLAYAKQKVDSAWSSTYPDIIKQINAPVFKPDTLLVEDSLNFRGSLMAAMQKLSSQGGGTVLIPAGKYWVQGPIVFESDINLHLAEGAILEFSDHPSDYLPVVKTRWEGTFAMNYAPLIYAIDKENIAITGKGEIDGNCENSWGKWKSKQEPDKMTIRQMGNDQIPIEARVFGEGHYLRPSGIEFINCRNILFEDFTIHHTPFWTIHPVLCENITARRLNIKMGIHNDDGFDPENSKNVLIEHCIINTYDDCISIKAGRDQDGWEYPPSENIVVRNNEFKSVVGSGFCIGSEMSGGVRNVFVHNNLINGSDKHAFQFKSNPDRGGFIEQVFIKDVQVTDTVAYAFEFTTDYKGWRGNEYFVKYNDFYFQNIDVNHATSISIKINGRKEESIKNVYFENVTIRESDAPLEAKHTENLLLEKVFISGKEVSNTLSKR